VQKRVADPLPLVERFLKERPWKEGLRGQTSPVMKPRSTSLLVSFPSKHKAGGRGGEIREGWRGLGDGPFSAWL